MQRQNAPALKRIQSFLNRFSASTGWFSLLLVLFLSLPAYAEVAVLIHAPKTVRELLEKHFTLPESRLAQELEQAAFMRRAQHEIPELMATEGYFSATVNLRRVSEEGVLELDVVPGPRTQVTAVKIELRGGLEQEPLRAQQLRESWLLPVGSVFRAADWERAKSELLAEVREKDYAAARLVASEAEVDVASATARLHLVLDAGERYVLGDIQVSGLVRYERSLVDRLADFQPGAPYQRKALLDFQAALQKLPQFSSVIVRLDTAAAKKMADGRLRAPVIVQIVEAKSRKLSLGIGYSTNFGARSEINYQSYNFLDQAWSLQGGINAEQKRQAATLGLDTPPNPVGYWLSWRGGVEKTEVQGLTTRRSKASVTRSRNRFNIETSVGLNWQQEQRLPRGGIRETEQALVLDWSWRRRAIDDPLAPMDGSLTELKLGGASKSVLSNQSFVRAHARHQSWIRLGKQDVLLLRMEGGYTASSSRFGIPQEYLFRVGGTQTVRGFAFQSLGVAEGDAIVGGRVMSTLSAEITHWFGQWGAALFVDSGGAADSVAALKLSTGYGVGARWKSPLGPLALDWARGRGEAKSHIHFAVAVAF